MNTSGLTAALLQAQALGNPKDSAQFLLTVYPSLTLSPSQSQELRHKISTYLSLAEKDEFVLIEDDDDEDDNTFVHVSQSGPSPLTLWYEKNPPAAKLSRTAFMVQEEFVVVDKNDTKQQSMSSMDDWEMIEQETTTKKSSLSRSGIFGGALCGAGQCGKAASDEVNHRCKECDSAVYCLQHGHLLGGLCGHCVQHLGARKSRNKMFLFCREEYRRRQVEQKTKVLEQCRKLSSSSSASSSSLSSSLSPSFFRLMDVAKKRMCCVCNVVVRIASKCQVCDEACCSQCLLNDVVVEKDVVVANMCKTCMKTVVKSHQKTHVLADDELYKEMADVLKSIDANMTDLQEAMGYVRNNPKGQFYDACLDKAKKTVELLSGLFTQLAHVGKRLKELVKNHPTSSILKNLAHHVTEVYSLQSTEFRAIQRELGSLG